MHSILITGGTGFLGQGLVKRLLNEEALIERRVRVYSRGEHAQARMQEAFGHDRRLAYFIGDVRDMDRLERAMQRCEIVIHAAALKRIEVGHYNPDELVKTNILGTMNVIEAARRAGVRRVVLVSTDKAFEPVSPYGLSKALAESLMLAANRQTLGPRFVVCRYGNVSGSTGSVIPRWRDLIAKGQEITITDPDCTRFWMRLEQAVEVVISAAVGDLELLIPTLPAYRVGDLAVALGASRTKFTRLDPWEKKHESMDHGKSSAHARRMSVEELRSQLAQMYPEAVAA